MIRRSAIRTVRAARVLRCPVTRRGTVRAVAPIADTPVDPTLLTAPTLVDHDLVRHAAHDPFGPGGHDLERWVVESAMQPNLDQLDALGIPADAKCLSGHIADGKQRWTYTAIRSLSAGTCERCAPASAAPTPDAGVSPERRYLDAFDAVSAIGADLVLDDRYHPGASVALQAWAAAHNKQIDRRDGPTCGWAGVLSVDVGSRSTASHRSIDVYLR